jgi:hypothetical protein
MTHIDTQDDAKVKENAKKVQRIFSEQELDKIWSDRWKRQKDLAYEHKTSRTQIKRILDRLKRERSARELSQSEIMSIAKATPKVKTELVTKLVESKIEAMQIESKYKSQKIETQSMLHESITCDIEKSRVLMQKATDMAMSSLSRAVGELDHSNAMAVMSVATAYEKMISAQQKHMATMLKVAERYGIVDETQRTPLIDQSVHNTLQSSTMVQYTPMMSIPTPLTAEEIDKMNAIAGEIIL